MKQAGRALIISISLLLLACVSAAQPVTSIKISTDPSGPNFLVDGQTYNSPQVFLWPAGSKHSLQFLLTIDSITGLQLGYQGANGDVARWFFSGWKDNLGLLAPSASVFQTITATPGLTSIVGSVSEEVKIALQFYNSPGGNPNCNGAPGNAPQDGWRYGVVYIDGVCYGDTTDIWTTVGTHALNAFPYPGFGFVGWIVDGGAPNAYLSTFTLSSTATLIPQFMPAKRVSFRTNPLGLQVVVDHSIITTPPSPPTSILPSANNSAFCNPSYTAIPGTAPSGYKPLCIGDFDFLPGSVHQIAAPSPQMDTTGKYWIFSGFSNGLPQNSSYVTDSRIDLVDAVYGNFVPGLQTSILTIPNGLKVQVDGRDNWPSTTFVWGQGETHLLNAPATQVDAQGRTWQFVSWSNGGSATQSLVVPSGLQGLAVTATYKVLGQVQIGSTPSGLVFTVDGSPCTTPCVVNHPSGAQMAVVVPASIPVSPSSRYDFDSWIVDGPTAGSSTNIKVAFNQDVQVFTANYRSSYLLAASANPAAGAALTFTPPSPDGFFASGTSVTVNAVVKGGYKFRQWTGDFSGTFGTAFLTMSVPHNLTAVLDTVPYIPPAGIINAAGPTPDGSVAAGSLISIYGQNLSGDLQLGLANPLAQVIDNVTVTANGLLFPLLFVSPQQINAQAPWELAPGTYTLTVHWQGQPDVTGPITVSRNAPGVYLLQNAQNLPLALAVHQDGSLITAASPARRHEIISIYTNGLGPFDRNSVDGYPTPITNLWTSGDPVSVVIGEKLTLTPRWSGAAPQMVGTDVVQLEIVDLIPTATTVSLVITANGNASSAVQLPVQ